MKNKFLSLSALLVAAIFAFAFKAEPMKFFADQQFILTNNTDPHNPANYTEFNGAPGASCPSLNEVCVIDVFEDDIYTEIDAPSEELIGKPKVEEDSDLGDDIETALSQSTDPLVLPSGRTVWQRD